ncbi:MAG: succinate dehydrogenase [Bacteroidetes bacterium]|jgi:succinate dehydrogenase / fumarate reductase, cytochrome b subunit|nr:MAG: succinate dehydrogenase [Bacteroidota bacterium]
MSVIAYLYSSSVGRKLTMGLSGLFLVSFLFVHLGGNMLLFVNDEGVMFNQFVRFMTTNPVIKVLEVVLFGGFIVHIIYAAILTAKNNEARPVKYAYSKGNAGSSTWFSRNMGLSGTIMLIFLIVHVTMFWGKFHFGGGREVPIEQAYHQVWKVKEVPEIKNDLGEVVLAHEGYINREALEIMKAQGITTVNAISMTDVVNYSFSNILVVLLYVVAMVLLSFHLNHGFQSAFRSVGFVHSKYTPALKGLGLIISVVFPAIFAAMPIWYFIKLTLLPH